MIRRKRAVGLFLIFSTLVVAGEAVAEERAPTGAPADWPMPVEDDQIYTFFETQKNEYQVDDDNSSYAWDAEGWIGTDYDKLWLKSEGEYLLDRGTTKSAELQALYGRVITPFWDALVGVRSEFQPDQAWDGAVGIHGLFPYFIEVEGMAFFNADALQFRLEGTYDLLITQQLIAQPRLEANFSTSDVAKRDVVAGLSELETGLRLRYEIIREVAPYVGFEYVRDEAAEDDKNSLRFVTGVRLWY